MSVEAVEDPKKIDSFVITGEDFPLFTFFPATPSGITKITCCWMRRVVPRPPLCGQRCGIPRSSVAALALRRLCLEVLPDIELGLRFGVAGAAQLHRVVPPARLQRVHLTALPAVYQGRDLFKWINYTSF